MTVFGNRVVADVIHKGEVLLEYGGALDPRDTRTQGGGHVTTETGTGVMPLPLSSDSLQGTRPDSFPGFGNLLQ